MAAAAAAAALRQFKNQHETREDARERRQHQRLKKEEKFRKKKEDSKLELERMRQAEADAKREEKEAIEAEQQAELEETEADQARTEFKKEEEDVLRVEKELLELEAKLGDGAASEAEVEAKREQLQREKQEVEDARRNVVKEMAEATAAKATAAIEKAEALLARAEAERCCEVAEEEVLAASRAEFDVQSTHWVQQRAEAMEPLEPEDMVFRLILAPAQRKAAEDKKEARTTTQKRKIDNFMNTMFLYCEYMHEDSEFLSRCFAMLDEDEDELLTEDELKTWLTVLNHGQAPEDDEVEQCLEVLDDYRRSLGAGATDGQLEESDFLLVTFDYYIACGPMYMRALFTDLLLS